MTTVAIIYHSGFGHTAVQAASVVEGVAGIDGVIPLTIDLASHTVPWTDLASCAALIFGSPTYMGSVSSVFKKFMEDSSGEAFRNRSWKDKLAAGFTNSGGLSGDKLGTLTTMAVFAAQHGMLWIGVDHVPLDDNQPHHVNRMAGFLGAMSQSGMRSSPETDPPSGDRATARLLGERVARAALRWRAGADAVASAKNELAE